MESSSWPECLPSKRTKVIQLLREGQELTNKLRKLLQHPEKILSNKPSADDMLVQISGMFSNTLSILSSCTFNEIPHILTNDIRSPSDSDGQKTEYTDESPQTVTPVKPKRGCHKRRTDSSWTSTKVTSALIDDGYAWRKYGQKAIIDKKHQRNYYRCTHKFDQGCRATKQVQKTEDEPPKYKVTYSGQHSCKNVLSVPQIILDSSNPKDSSIFLSFETKEVTKSKQLLTFL